MSDTTPTRPISERPHFAVVNGTMYHVSNWEPGEGGIIGNEAEALGITATDVPDVYSVFTALGEDRGMVRFGMDGVLKTTTNEPYLSRYRIGVTYYGEADKVEEQTRYATSMSTATAMVERNLAEIYPRRPHMIRIVWARWMPDAK